MARVVSGFEARDVKRVFEERDHAKRTFDARARQNFERRDEAALKRVRQHFESRDIYCQYLIKITPVSTGNIYLLIRNVASPFSGQLHLFSRNFV